MIEIIQTILKQSNRYDLAVLLDGATFTDFLVDNWNGGIGSVEVRVHPNRYLECLALSEDDLSLLVKIFDGLPHDYFEIDRVTFAINTEIGAVTIDKDVTYIFVDEAGDMDFSSKGSKYYMFNFLVKKRPFGLHEHISNYRYSLLERNLEPENNNRLDIEAFHAHKDNKHIKAEMFNIISTFDPNAVKVYAYILEKPKVLPEKRKEKERFYIDNLSYAIGRLLSRIDIDRPFIIITDRLPIQKNRSKQIGALKKGIKLYLQEKGLKFRYDIFHHCSASSANLQIIDYISWAIFRKYEHKQGNYYEKIKQYIIDEEVMTKERRVSHYEK